MLGFGEDCSLYEFVSDWEFQGCCMVSIVLVEIVFDMEALECMVHVRYGCQVQE